jgi:hypothetical protein
MLNYLGPFDLPWLGKYLSSSPKKRKMMVFEHYLAYAILAVVIALVVFKYDAILAFFYGQDVSPNAVNGY